MLGTVLAPLGLVVAFTLLAGGAATAAPEAGAAATKERPEFVVVSLGDSYAAGEGNPVRSGDFDIDGKLRRGGQREAWGGYGEVDPSWGREQESDLCHRSRLAGAAVAARRLQREYPDVHVVFQSFACSGATVPEGLIGPYAGSDGPLKAARKRRGAGALPPQISQLNTWLGSRSNKTINALVVGIGGNDLGFPNIVALCLIPKDRVALAGGALGAVVGGLLGGPFALATAQIGAVAGTISGAIAGGCQGFGLETSVLDNGLKQVRSSYADLARALEGKRAGPSSVKLDARPEKIYIPEYPDPSRNERGAACDGTGFPSTELYGQIDAAESRWIAREVLPRVNGAVRAAARTHGWDFVGGIAAGYRQHGVCAAESWFVSGDRALQQQGADVLVDVVPVSAISAVFGRPLGGGIAHPNELGQELYGERIFEKLDRQLREDLNIPDLTLARVSPTKFHTRRVFVPAKSGRGGTFRNRAIPIPGTGRIEVRWNRPAGVVRSFELVRGSTPPLRLPSTVTSHAQTITGRGTFRIRTCGRFGCSPYSRTVVASTIRPSTPTHLRRQTAPGLLRSRSITVRWSPADGNQTYFQVEYRRIRPHPPAIAATSLIVPAGQTELTLGGLSRPLGAGDEYTFRVRACSNVGCSSWTSAITEPVLEPSS